jgi:ABC-type nitrate/sulfonate/bicarbonate transport system ATPase subunit
MEEAVLLGDRVIVLSPRPGRVHEAVTVSLPRPRPPDIEKDPNFVELKEYLWEKLRGMQVDLVPRSGNSSHG